MTILLLPLVTTVFTYHLQFFDEGDDDVHHDDHDDEDEDDE